VLARRQGTAGGQEGAQVPAGEPEENTASAATPRTSRYFALTNAAG